MSDEEKYGRMRPIQIGDDVTITLPAHIWLGFVGAYAATRWESADASTIMHAVHLAVFDPVWLKERTAHIQRQNDEQHRRIATMIPGFPVPEVPPDAGEITDDSSPE